MRDFADPANPYLGQYNEWDYWCLANANAMTNEDWTAWTEGSVPETRRMLSYGVDKDGFPVPLLAQRQQQMEQQHDAAQQPESSCVVSFIVYGDIPPALDLRMLQAEMQLKAQYAPPIPQWLAQQPPLWALILPTGEVVTAGELGTGRDFDMNYTRQLKEDLAPYSCYRYSPDGRLLGQTQPDEQWYTMFWPEATATLSQYNPDDTIYWIENGYVIVRDYRNWNVTALFDYDGTPLPVDTNIAARDANVWEGWYGREIPLLYAAQHQMKR